MNYLWSVYAGILLHDFLRYVLAAGTAFLIFWVFAKRKLSHRFIQQRFPKNKQLWSEFLYSMNTVVIFSINGLCLYFMSGWGLTRIHPVFSDLGLGWSILGFAAMVVFHDAYFYWTHRIMHLPNVYRYVHRVHHRSTNPSPWAAYSFHPLEAIVQALGFSIMLVCIPLHTITIFIFLAFMIVRNVFGHLGYELLPRNFVRSKWLNWSTTSTHHNLHHKKFHGNYGLYFTWWDQLMGTTAKEYERVFEEVTTRRRPSNLEVST